MALNTIMTLILVKRLKNTLNGNARYELTFSDGSVYKTKPNSSVVYAVPGVTSTVLAPGGDGRVAVRIEGKYITEIDVES